MPDTVFSIYLLYIIQFSGLLCELGVEGLNQAFHVKTFLGLELNRNTLLMIAM